jgi:pimeloyl-ACP methyl ester carboxylesterase
MNQQLTSQSPAAASHDAIASDPEESETAEAQIYPHFKFLENVSNASLPQARYTTLTGTLQLSINKVLVSVVYSLPRENNHLAETASNLIFYGPYPGEKTKLDGNIIPDIVTKLGCGVFSFQFEGLGEQVSNLPYWCPDAGWFEAALRARDLLIQKYGLDRKKLILFGYSGGAGMVMNFAGAYPDQVEAVAAQAPNVVPSASLESKIKWLLVVNRGDTNRLVMKPFYEQLRSRKCSILYCETTPDRSRGQYHAPSSQTFDLIYSYLAGILDQRRQVSEGVTDAAQLWPYAAPTAPLQRYAIAKTSDLQPEDLNSGSFDLLPSLAFAFNWSQVCPPQQNVISAANRGRLIVNFPARPEPSGVILYYAAADYSDIPREVEDINSLAEHGYLVVSSMTTNPEDFIDAATSWLKSQDKLKGVHIHLIGNGPTGAKFIGQMAGRSDVSFKSVSLIDFNDSTYNSDCLEGVFSAAKECGMYGFYSYSDSEADTIVCNWAEGLVDQGSRDRGCFNVCAKPADPPKDSEGVRHMNAENDALAMVKTLIHRADAP